jgi:hypothetical protein
MSLAMYAAPFNNDNNDNDLSNGGSNGTLIDRKRNNHNKTQKRNPFSDYQSQNSEKVNAVLQSIHSKSAEDTNNLGDFTFIPPPTSVGVENTKMRESVPHGNSASNNDNNRNNSSNYSNNRNQESFNNIGNINMNDEDVDIQALKNNYMNDKAVEKYYQNLIPNYNQNAQNKNEYNKPYYPANLTNLMPNNSGYDMFQENGRSNLLMDKLNYMINLLEEQQDERTNNVTEEVVLYSFLGIFIIFIVDSFARVGKYVR